MKGVIEEELVDGVVEWREERSCGGADGEVDELGNREEWRDPEVEGVVVGE